MALDTVNSHAVHGHTPDDLRDTLRWLGLRAFELGQERDDLRESLEAARGERESCRKEQKEMGRALAECSKKLERYKLAFGLLFPEELYRKRRPDVGSYAKEELIEHFVFHGLEEGYGADLVPVEVSYKELETECNQLQATIAEMEEQAKDYSQQLSLLKDMISRMLLNK